MGPEHKSQGLQAARAIAALAVAYFHSYVALRASFPETVWHPIPWLIKWGFAGVDFFFVISGYVICLVLSRPSFTLRGFVIKRIFRLYPMYWVAMAMVAALIAIGKYYPQPLGHFLYSMTLLPQEGTSAYDFSWTLEREVVFYFLAALVVPIAGVNGLAVVLAALAFSGWLLGNPWTFHLTATSQSEFLAGVLVFIARGPIARLGGAFPLALGVALTWYFTSIGPPFTYWPPIAMAPLLAGMLNLRLPWSRAPLRWLVLAGDASYSIYLLHYLVFFGSGYLSVWLFKLPPWACEPWRLASILACCLISYATWRLIEKPFITFSERLAARSERSAAPSTGRADRATVPTEGATGELEPVAGEITPR
jgi:exopolysaccharide production protein ExoZ